MTSMIALADELWNRMRQEDPFYATLVGEPPAAFLSVSESAVAERSAHARSMLAQLGRLQPDPAEADVAAVIEALLLQRSAAIDEMWHIHLTAPYQAGFLATTAVQAITSQPEPERRRLTAEFDMQLRSIAGLVREQRERGIVLPAPAVPAARATWERLRVRIPVALGSDTLAAALDTVLAELEASARVADEPVGMAQLAGGEPVYRARVRHQITEPAEPEDLHRMGLEDCAMLAEQMRELRLRLGGPADEAEARTWLQRQSHLYANAPEQVAQTYRRHVRHMEAHVGKLFHILPRAAYDVRRLDPASETGMTFGYYQPPTASDPIGVYHFNGSSLATRSQLGAAGLILHELIPGHHLHFSRQQENEALHPLQRFAVDFVAFNEGWGEYAASLGWETGAYEDDWDAYGNLAQQRMVAQRLVVDTALNLGWWTAERARDFMRVNTLEGEEQITSEIPRYSTDLPAQALAYRTGFVAFRDARRAHEGADVRDIHEAMIGGGAVPLTRMRERVAETQERRSAI